MPVLNNTRAKRRVTERETSPARSAYQTRSAYETEASNRKEREPSCVSVCCEPRTGSRSGGSVELPPGEKAERIARIELRLAKWGKARLNKGTSAGWVAQLVEQRTENPCVGGSIPPPATILNRGMARS